MAKTVICKNPTCPRNGKPFRPQRAGARYCGDACRMAAHRHQQKTAQPPWTAWSGDILHFSPRPSRLTNYDGNVRFVARRAGGAAAGDRRRR
jgi:hypothetical protein